MATAAAPPRFQLTRQQWLICGIAALGFCFDIYELLMLPLILRPALSELLGATPGTPLFNQWAGLLFYVPALFGGVFGLLGGYLTDRFGRRRVLVASILIYAIAAFASGFATSVELLLMWRCFVFVGVCVEFVAGIAWLAELFPEPVLREKVLGFTQAFSSLGGFLVTGAYKLCVNIAPSLPEIAGSHSAWRYTLISGVIPALPLILVRPWLPESPAWAERRAAGTLKRPSLREIFSPKLRRVTIVATLLTAVSYAFAFGALQQNPRIVPGLEGVAGQPPKVIENTVSNVQFSQELGGLTGRILMAFLAVYIVSRQRLLRLFLVPAAVLMPLLYLQAPDHGWAFLAIGVFAGGLLTVGQFNFWGNYLPQVYPTHLRGTGESFAANVGGRMIGTSAAYVATQLANVMPGAGPAAKLAHSCALVALTVGIIGLIASFWLPEPDPDQRNE